jgi:hypothetical protein
MPAGRASTVIGRGGGGGCGVLARRRLRSLRLLWEEVARAEVGAEVGSCASGPRGWGEAATGTAVCTADTDAAIGTAETDAANAASGDADTEHAASGADSGHADSDADTGNADSDADTGRADPGADSSNSSPAKAQQPCGAVSACDALRKDVKPAAGCFPAGARAGAMAMARASLREGCGIAAARDRAGGAAVEGVVAGRSGRSAEPEIITRTACSAMGSGRCQALAGVAAADAAAEAQEGSEAGANPAANAEAQAVSDTVSDTASEAVSDLAPDAKGCVAWCAEGLAPPAPCARGGGGR